MNIDELGFVLITDYVTPNCNSDVSDGIQRAIDENPNRTIYFPDGEYILAKPILTPSDPKLSVSLKLSNYAKLKAAADWDSEEGMVRLGASHPVNNIRISGSNYFFEGGIIDGSGVAIGISIDGGRETAVRNVSIKSTFIGLRIKWGINSGSSDADIDTVNIVCNGKEGSVGLLVEAYDNTFTNMRIAGAQIGVKIVQGGNFFRNLHPLYSYTEALEGKYLEGYGFYDISGGNWYDFCYSDQYANGFYAGADTNNVYDSCRTYWYTDRGNHQVGFIFDGKYHSVMNSCAVNLRFPKVEGKYMTVKEEGGLGTVSSPIVQEPLNHDDCYKQYMTNRAVWVKK